MTPTLIPTSCPLCGGTNWKVEGLYRYCGTCTNRCQVMPRTDTVYIASTFSQTIQEAWDDSEGLYVCTEHFRQHAWSLRSGYRLVPVPADMTDQVKAEGQCATCWDDYANTLRESCEADESARWEGRLA